MTFLCNFSRFVSNLFVSDAGKDAARGNIDTSLSDTARDMRIVNMSAEDDRLDSSSTQAYSNSFKRK
ncbi:MAG: hypothetical protein ACI91O_000119 [Candidatus Poriferisodalaceae bacterium]|jgi:hypothetical protein